MERNKLISLVEGLQQSKPHAAENLYNAFYKDLYFHIYKTVDDSSLAEDLLQETFMEIFLKIKDLKEPAAFVSWSRQIAYSKCTAHFRKTHEILVDENEEGYSIFDTLEEEREEFIPGEALNKEDLKKTIQQIISDLPGEQRSAILLHYFDELSVKDIAEIQGVSEGTVKSRLNYGRKSIKEAVETYEKKNGIKLHCLGVVPLLLWLLKAQAAAATPASTSANLFAAGAAIADVATSVDTLSDVASSAGTVAETAAKKGANAIGKFFSKKVVAGIAAACIAAGGATTAILSQPDSKPEPPMIWTGCGEVLGNEHALFDLTIEEMNESEISGSLVVTYEAKTVHSSTFTGSGTVVSTGINYDTIFETPAVYNVFLSLKSEIQEIELHYDEKTDVFSFSDTYNVNMSRISGKAPEVLAENESWSGMGKDDFYNSPTNENHLFEVDIERMTAEEISGTIRVSYNGTTDHVSAFSGRGHIHNGVTVYYDVILSVPRVEEKIITIELERFYITYDLYSSIMEIDAKWYSVKMNKIPAN